jgi:hypothetical protein
VFAYSAYNLCVYSEFPFPELIPCKPTPEITKRSPDVLICLRQIHESEAKASDGGHSFLGFLELENSIVGRFLVEFGHKIVVEPDPGIDEALIRPFILGPAFAILLRQRGLLVLHSSSIVMNGGTVGFTGHSGMGKSTLANAFYNQGYPLLTDDIMAIQVEGKQPLTFPGYPYVKLLPDAANALGYNFETLSLIHTGVVKRNNCLIQGFQQTPLPIWRLYVLEDVQVPQNEIEVLKFQDAVVQLIRYSRATNLLLSPEFVGSHFRQCSNLVKSVSVCRLKRKRSLAGLLDLIKLVEEDIAQNCFQSSDREIEIAPVQ